jgi:hypothetical protein
MTPKCLHGQSNAFIECYLFATHLSFFLDVFHAKSKCLDVIEPFNLYIIDHTIIVY